jgi:streptogramin lyase
MSFTPKTLKINVDADDPAEALVVDNNNLTAKSIGTIVAGDFLEYIITPTSLTGTSSLADSSSFNLQVGIGRYDVGVMARSSNFYTSQSYGWTGSLNTNTGSFTNVINASNADSYQANFEVVIIRKTGAASGSHTTILQSPITIRQQVII